MKSIVTLFFLLLVSHTCLADAPVEWQIDFQNPASPIMHELKWFHDFLLIISASIVIFVFMLLAYVVVRFNAKSNPIPATFTHNIAIEVIWTVIPILILVMIAVPSFRILRMAEHSPPADMTIKVVGSQWFWTYSYPDHDNIEFDSYMILEKDLKPGQRRLLEVDRRIVIPESTNVKFLITAADVVHSFAIPALGIKTDAVPGKTNETWTRVEKRGVYYGQCSELCGVNHGFMPIALEVVSKEDFEKWLLNAKQHASSKNQKYNFVKNN